MVSQLYTLNYFTCAETCFECFHKVLYNSSEKHTGVSFVHPLVQNHYLQSLCTSLSVPFCVFCWNAFFFLNSIFWHVQEFHPIFVSIHSYPQVTSSVYRFNFYLYTDSSWHICSSSLSL